MSRSEQAFTAATEGTEFTMYAMMRKMGIPLSLEQEKFQTYLESMHPAIINKEPICQNYPKAPKK